MKKIVIALAITASASVAFGAMGTGLGLPKAWTFSADRGYGAKAVGGTTANQRNGASSMCVDCHTVNPSDRVMQLSDQGASTLDRSLADNGGSHFVMNLIAGGGTNPWGGTHSGGGNGASFGGAARDNGAFFRSGAWAATSWTNGGLSKFGTGAALVSVTEGDGGSSAANADMICESCHNLVQNVQNSANDNDLLLAAYRDNADDALCTGCHAQNETTRGAFHNNSNIPNFSGASRKYHHVMTGDTVTIATDYPPDGVSGRRWAPSFTELLGDGWCTPANKFNTAARGTATNIGATFSPTFRNSCNIAGSGTRDSAIPATLGDIVIGGDGITCASCHRPHNAKTGAGAHIFRIGDQASADVNPGNATTANYAGTDNTSFTGMYEGLQRQADVSGGKVYGEYRALCLGCHVGY